MFLLAIALVASICHGSTAAERAKVTPQMKSAAYARAHIPRAQRRLYVIDHRLPLELGGKSVPSNLFPQPRAEAHTKDLEENALHKAVCSGKMTLAAAQAKMLRDWAR